jgi:hypothetical protein
MRSAIILITALAACGCAQNATQPAAEAPQAAPAPDAPPPEAANEPAEAAIDSRAPNWRIESIKLADNRWRVELRMRSWHTGGDGEAEVLFRDQARELAQEQGYRHYVVLSWVQGIESSFPFPRRWARGDVELQDAVPPMPLDQP